ncbi:conjugal transfer protein TraD [Candidatus Odyssella thessalonicensis]|uniref:conjugal transfer protein TraD n=1 Tax=Candidatus Odyssella thessalonicensis TaxID=84647 RepID=UPI000225BB3D|nr:conjugal transfer protein TraD [Candidatus Odyssella thessalonicensis]
MKNQTGMASYGFRKARTRTLIQLGGLIEKAGLFETLGIVPGSDLQKDPAMQSLALSLLGAFLEVKQTARSEEGVLNVWQLKAQEFLNK